MNILGIFLVTLYLFLPWIGRSGTNVWVLVNSPCGPTENSSFAVRFLPSGKVFKLTDEMSVLRKQPKGKAVTEKQKNNLKKGV